MEGVQVTKLDVLADSFDDNGKSGFSFDKYRHHIGNIQFNIIAGLYREPFQKISKGKGDDKNDGKINEECDLITSRLNDLWTMKGLSAVAHRGRFLISDAADDGIGKISWKEADDTQAKAIVSSFLMGDPMAETEEEALILDAADTLDSLNVANLTAQNSNIDGPLIEDEESGIGIIIAAGAQVLLDERKRPRRPSHLRRSMSEAMIMDKKKFQRQDFSLKSDSELPHYADGSGFGSTDNSVGDSSGNFNVSGMRKSLLDSTGDIAAAVRKTIATEPTPVPTSAPTPPAFSGMMSVNRLAISTGNNNSVISTHGKMDVVLSSDCSHLSSTKSNVGNNRLEVMLTLQRKNYPKLSPIDQNKAAVDLVKMVCNFWGGRILVEVGPSYLELTFNQGVTAMKSLLSQQHGTSGPIGIPGIGPPVPSSVPSQPFSFPQPLSLATNSRTVSCPPPTFNGAGILPAQSAGRHMSADISSSDLKPPGSEDMQKAARSSLQQRKVKRGLAKKLGMGSGGTPSLPNGEIMTQSFSSLNNLGYQK